VPERKRGRGGFLKREMLVSGTTPSSLTSFEASPYFLRLRAIALALRAGSRFAVREALPS